MGAIALVAVAGCTQHVSFSLHLLFPDDEARHDTEQVDIWVLDPAGGTCNELQAGTLRPDTMTIQAQLVIRFSSGQDTSKLRDVPAGEQIFFAEGQTAAGAIILRGCVLVDVDAGGEQEVSVHLERICTPHPGGEIPRDGIDNDCDGKTDECTSNRDCEDGSVCTGDLCVSEECHSFVINDGGKCNDNNLCTVDDKCEAGVCVGQERDCTEFDGQCEVGSCTPETGTCHPAPRDDGTPCDDGLSCSQDDACHQGICSGLPRSCDDDDPCTRDRCDEGVGCVHVQDPKPGAEGPGEDPTCTDGVDNDCDGLTDAQDPNCLPCENDNDCNDDNPCTDDRCTDGTCQNAPVEDGTECDDGYYCTVNDRCEAGVCTSSARDCSGVANACQLGVCNEAQGRCEALARADSTPCEDGAFCTVGDRCVEQACVPGDPRVCDDSDFCTDDSCDEDLDRCSFVIHPRPGEEGPPGEDTCYNAQDDDCDGLTDLDDGNCSDCVTDEDCDDNNPCTEEHCEPPVCVSTAVSAGTPCDDGDSCTMNDACDGDACTGLPTDADGDGYVAAPCGGTDCDDDAASVHPGAREEPAGDSSCTDGADNDCDGLVDQADPGCWNPACSADGFCWENPLPQGNGLAAVYGLASDDVWAVGWAGTILHWDGISWIVMESGTRRTLYGVWGSAPDDVWVAGETTGTTPTLLHWDGQDWTPHAAGVSVWAYGLHGVAPDRIWAPVAGSDFLYWNGSSWSRQGAPGPDRFLGVWASSEHDIWGVGYLGGIVHSSDGIHWTDHTDQSGLTSEILYDVWMAATDDVWAVGENGTLLHFDGSTWSKVPVGTTEHLYDVWGTAADDVWVAGGGRTLLHNDGDDWSVQQPGLSRSNWFAGGDDLRAIWGASPEDVWVVGGAGSLLHFDGDNWAELSRGSRQTIGAIWGSDTGPPWAVGSGGQILRRDHVTRTWYREESGTTRDLHAICGSTDEHVLVAGEEGAILAYNGNAWVHQDSGTTQELAGVWTNGASSWTVGAAGTVLHRAGGGAWLAQDSQTASDLNDVWATGTDDFAVVVGDEGTILHWNGSGWNPQTSGTGESLYAVWGTSATDVWAAGRTAEGQPANLRHWDGSGWSLVPCGVSDVSLRAIWGRSPQDIWVVGSSFGESIVLHYDGSTWEQLDSGTDNRLGGIWGDATGHTWVAGNEGTILVHAP